MADWDGLRHDLETGVTPPPLDALRARRRRRQQRRTIAVTCAVAMVGTASGAALLGRAAERERARHPIAAPPTEVSKVVNSDTLPPPRDYEEHVVTDVDFVSPTTGWAIGLRCVGETCDVATWRTDDGGATWSAPSDVATAVPRVSFHEEDPGGGAVRALRMVDDRRGYAFNPDLYVTADGGGSWQRVPQPSKVTSVSVVGESVWVTQRGCPRDVDCDVVVRTGSVGSDLLRPLRVPETNGAAAVVRRAGADRGYLLAWDAPRAPHASLHVTGDGGRTWRRRTHPCPDATAASLSAAAGRPAWVVCTGPGGRGAFQSADDGATWQRVGDPPADGEVTDLVAWSADDAYLTLQAPGRLLVTHDAGRTWLPAEGTARAYGYANLDVVSPTAAFAMGDAGQLWRTTDGRRWERLALPPRAPRATTTPGALPPADDDVELTGLSFTDERSGWALGRRCHETRCRLALRRTTDGGATWTVANAPPEPFADHAGAEGDVRSVVFADERTGYLYGPGLFVTRDGGAHWKRLPGRVAEVVVRDGYAWTLEYATCAGGEPCSPQVGRAPAGFDEFAYGFVAPDSPVRGRASLAVAGRDTAYLVAATGGDRAVVLATSDGGRTWRRHAAPCRDAHVRLASAAAGDLWVLCGARPGDVEQAHHTAHSRDGGRTWTVRRGDSHGRLDRFVALSPTVAWRADAGPLSALRVTRDGGVTWQEAPLPAPGIQGRVRAFGFVGTLGYALFTDAVVTTTDGRTWTRRATA